MRISDWSSDVCSSDLGAQAIHVDAVDDGALGEHGNEPRDTKLGCLFRDPIDAAAFDRCEEKPEVGNGLAFAEVRDEAEADVPFSGVRQLRQPFAGVVVEQLDLAAGRSEEHTSELQ